MKAPILISIFISILISFTARADVAAGDSTPASTQEAAAGNKPSNAQMAEPNDTLLLAGGALPICSSINQEQCNGKPPTGLRASPERLRTDANGQRLREVVDFQASKSSAAKAIYLHFVAMARAAHLARTGQAVARPKILFLTSASQDPFDAVDFYQGTLQQAGADAQWLPLDAAVREAFGAACHKLASIRKRINNIEDRSAIYPDLAKTQLQFCQNRGQLLQLLQSADGLFFNGGDQYLSKSAWFDDGKAIAEFTELKKRLALGHLVVGGTSAGTAVMSSNVMITNGESATALVRGAKATAPPPIDCTRKKTCPPGLQEDDLTYDDAGGLALFTLGILDTHFAARERQGRLARLLIDSHMRFGFGVDEGTALLVAKTKQGQRLRALGAGQVWIFDAQNRNDAAALARQYQLLRPGDTLLWAK